MIFDLYNFTLLAKVTSPLEKFLKNNPSLMKPNNKLNV